MGQVATAVDANGGTVIGIIPTALVSHESQGFFIGKRQEIVDTMHERKARMCDLTDAFIALPGGFGTLDEMFEAATWTQLGIHRASVGLLNAGGYYDYLIKFLHSSTEIGLLSARSLSILCIESDPVKLLDNLELHECPPSFIPTSAWPIRPL